MTLSFLTSDSNAILAAMNKSQAIIEFSLEGKILRANENFCRALGYDLKEIVGQHHCMFVDPAEASTPAYAEFWRNSPPANLISGNTSVSGKGGARFGSRLLTILFSGVASPTRS